MWKLGLLSTLRMCMWGMTAGINQDHSHSTHIIREHAHTPSVILMCPNVALQKVSVLYNSLHTGTQFMMLFCCVDSKRPNRIFTKRSKSVNKWRNVSFFKKAFITSQNNDLINFTHNWNLCVTNTSIYKPRNFPYINCSLHCTALHVFGKVLEIAWKSEKSIS